MAKTTLTSQLAAANARIAELEAQLAARDARLAVATQVFKDQRSHIRELEAKLNTRGVVATDPRPENDHASPDEAEHARKAAGYNKQHGFIKPIITRYTDRFGHTFEKTRVGNRAITREITIN